MIIIVVMSSKMLLTKESNVFASTGRYILSSLFYSLTISSGWLNTEEKRLRCTATTEITALTGNVIPQLTSRQCYPVVYFSSSLILKL